MPPPLWLQVPEFERARLDGGRGELRAEILRAGLLLSVSYVAGDPADIAARKLLAATQLRLGRSADAADTLGPVKDETTDVELLQLIGEASARGGDMPAARRYLNLALKHQPDNGMLRTQLGIAELANGDAGAAIQNLERVAAIYPAASLPELPLFVAFMQTKDYARALATAERLKKAEPSEPTGETLDRRRLSKPGQAAGRTGSAVASPRNPARRHRLERYARKARACSRQTGCSPPVLPEHPRRASRKQRNLHRARRAEVKDRPRGCSQSRIAERRAGRPLRS